LEGGHKKGSPAGAGLSLINGVFKWEMLSGRFLVVGPHGGRFHLGFREKLLRRGGKKEVHRRADRIKRISIQRVARAP